MGTRSLTRVIGDGNQVLNMYRQMDGYPSGHGMDLYRFLNGIKITNGIGLVDEGQRIANGAGCLAAQIVAEFKDGPGSIYLVNGAPGNHYQDYEYIITANHFDEPVHQINIKVRNYRKKILFEGDVEAFGNWCDTE